MSDFTPAVGRKTASVSVSLPDATTVAAIGAITAAAVLRLILLFHFRIDSDETQHLHVAWGWAHGLVPYRDFFDNHMPLFHVLAVPLFWIAGERPEILLLARIAMLPLFAAIVILTYRIASSVYDRRTALWATLVALLVPDFFLCSLEFRTDDLWALLWVAAIATVVLAPLTQLRAATAGLLIGLAATVSAKTALLVVVLAAAAIVSGIFKAKHAIAFAAAAIAPPLLVALFFAWRGGWQSFVYCTITHNLVAPEHPQRLLLFPVSLALIALVTVKIARDDAEAELRRRRVFLFLASSLYAAALISLWPVIQTEHWLPFYPIAAAGIIPLVRPSKLAMALVAIELVWIVSVSAPARNDVRRSLAQLGEVTRLTAPGEHVVDLKGELLFRPRASYFVFEKFTRHAIAQGRIADTVASDVLRTRAMVAVPDATSFPRLGREFLLRNFIRTGCVRVAGKLASGTFRIEVPARYAVLTDRGDFHGLLDGAPYSGARFLDSGSHTITSDQRTAVIWERAATLGFSPWIGDPRCR